MTRLLLDTDYYPNWFTGLGYDPNAIYQELDQISTAERSSPWMKYRGHELKRSKFFFVELGPNQGVPVYSYPGFQYRSVLQEYHQISEHPLISGIQQLIETQFGHRTNHVIGTVYYNQNDNIGWHDDKTATIDPTVPIYIFSFGQQRPLSIRQKPTETIKDRFGKQIGERSDPPVICQVPMEQGSLCILGHQTNSSCQHAILPTNQLIGKRISLIFRKVVNVVSLAEIHKKVKTG